MVEQGLGVPKDYSRYPFTPEEWDRMKTGTEPQDKLFKAIFGGRYITETRTDEELETLRLRRINSIRGFVSKTLGMPIEEVPIDDYEALDELKNQADELSLQQAVSDRLAGFGLTSVEVHVLRLRVGGFLGADHPYTQAEVGKKIGKSRSTAGRIERQARKKLQEHPEYPEEHPIYP